MSQVNRDVIEQAINDPNFSFIDSFADVSEPENIQKEMTRLLFMHRKKRQLLKTREREKVIIQHNYEKKKRESYIKHNETAPNERTKSILVDIDTEQEKYELEIIEQKIRELNRSLSSIKLELDALKSISYSVRTTMGLI